VAFEAAYAWISVEVLGMVPNKLLPTGGPKMTASTGQVTLKVKIKG
jgi:hypothetical protein